MAMAEPVGLGSKLRDFFAQNPDEELSYGDVMAKFGCSHGNLRTTVSRLVANGEIEVLHVVRRSQIEREASPRNNP
jgi:hypothetical protein